MEAGSDFSHKNGGVSKIGWELLLIFILSNLPQCYLSLSVLCVCVCGFFIIYVISIRIICASQEELSLIASNQQIYDFYK